MGADSVKLRNHTLYVKAYLRDTHTHTPLNKVIGIVHVANKGVGK